MLRRHTVKNKYPVKSLAKALRILDVLGENPSGRGISEIGKALHIGKSTVHRLLNTLKDEGFVLMNPYTSRYILGFKVAKLADQLSHQSPLLTHALPVIERLAMETNETACLAVLDGTEIVYIGARESKERLRQHIVLGDRFPAHVSALGKACLSGLSDSEVQKLYNGARKLPRLTPNTLGNIKDLLAELASVRSEGIAVDNEEGQLGVCCIGAPIRDFSGKVVAAMSFTMPIHRFTAERERIFRDALLRGTAELSARLGYLPGQTAVTRKS